MAKLKQLFVLLFLMPGLTGCIGIAHSKFTAPPLEVVVSFEARAANENASIRLLKPDFYGQSELWLDIVNQELQNKDFPYRQIVVKQSKGEAVRHRFPAESRYIGFPALIPLGLLAPGKDVGESQTLWLYESQNELVFRVRLVGTTISTDEVDVAVERAKLWAAEPGYREVAAQSTRPNRITLNKDALSNAQWRQSNRIVATILQRTEGLDVLAIQIRP